ncbi:MAG: HAD family hydrolase [Syntrophales bacterium]|nr:HAD family hydrolase [Syntrophales bacterium]MDD5642071.1 HAD family hydrolase [Syntrophales bacterium]
MLKLIAFDCDGVLFDSRAANIAFYNAILQQFGLPPLTPIAVEYVHSHTVFASLEYLFRDYPDLDAVRQFARTLDYHPFIPMMVEEPYLREFLEFLRPNFVSALATNRSTTTRAVLKYHRLEEHFDLVISALDVSRPKPDPESFWRILNHFGLEPQEAIYIGDSRVDEEFARNAGVPLVAYRNPELQANYHLDSFAGAPALISALSAGKTGAP